MEEEEKVGHLMKGIAEDFYQALIVKDPTTVDEMVKFCRQLENMKQRRIKRTRYERLPNVTPISSDFEEDLTLKIRRIVQEELQKIMPKMSEVEPFRTTDVNSLEAKVKEEVQQVLAPITRRSIQSQRRRTFVPRFRREDDYTPYAPRTSDQWRTVDNHPICFHCGKPGHVLRYCRERRRTFEKARLRRTLPAADNATPQRPYDLNDDFPTLPRPGGFSRSASPYPGRGRMPRRRSQSPGAGRFSSRSPRRQNEENYRMRDLYGGKEFIMPSLLTTFWQGKADLWIANGTSKPLLIPSGMALATMSDVDVGSICSLKCDELIQEEDIGITKLDQKIEAMIDSNLTEDQQNKLINILKKFSDVFDFSGKSQPARSKIKHKIDTGDHAPTKQRPYRVSGMERKIIHQEVDRMMKQDIIQFSESPWSSPVVLVKKKNGSWRFCVDYRRLNKITKKDVYPLPRVDNALDNLSGARYYSSMDLRTGYWQIEVDEHDREKTAFITPDGLYEFRSITNLANIIDKIEQTGPFKGFEVVDGVLYKINYEPYGRQRLLVLPKQMRLEILKNLHDAPTAGHLGFAKTYDRARKRFFWGGMYKTIRQYIAHCRECQRRKSVPQRPPGLLMPIPQANFPFQKIGMDLLGRFPATNQGNKWIIVCTEYMTRFATTKAIPDAGAMEIAKFIVEEIILRHGAPQQIITDCGTNFMSQIIKEINNLSGISHLKTTAYHPQTNGLTERLNKTLTDMLSMYVDVEQKNWDEVLPFVTFAYNTAKQETTGFSPFFLVHGCEAEITLDSLLPYHDNDNVGDYVQHLITTAEEARHLAQLHHYRGQEKDRVYYDRKYRPVNYNLGDQVWLFIPVRNVGLSEKLIKKYFGPYHITRKLSPVNYEIEAISDSPKHPKVRKCDLSKLAYELGEVVPPESRIVDLKRLILNSQSYEEEFAKQLLETLIEEREQTERAERERMEQTAQTEQAERIERERIEDRKRIEDRERIERKEQMVMEFELEKLRIQTTRGNNDTSRSTSNDAHYEIRKLMPKYESKDNDLSFYLILFERQAKRLGLDEDQWAFSLLGLLPYEMTQLIARETEEQSGDYRFVKRLLLKRYKLSPEQFRQKFEKHERSQKGSWRDFAFELRGYFNEWIEGMNVENFDALKDLSVTNQLKKKVPNVLRNHLIDDWTKLNNPDELADKLDEYENVRTEMGPPHWNAKHLIPPSFQQKSARFPNQSEVKETKQGTNVSGQDAARNEISETYPNTLRRMVNRTIRNDKGEPKCFNCNQFGHIARDCPAPRTTLTCRGCGQTGHKERNCTRPKEGLKVANLEVEGLETVPPDVYLKDVKIDNKETVKAMIDTGSSSCLMRESVARRISVDIEPDSTSLYGIGNQTAPAARTVGKTTVDLEIDGIVGREITVFIVNDDAQPYDLLIGRTWTDLPYVSFARIGKNLHIGYSSEFPFANLQEEIKSRRIELRATETVQLESDSINFTSAITDEVKDGYVLFTGVDDACVDSLLEVVDGKTTVPIISAGKGKLRVRKNQCVGRVELLNLDDIVVNLDVAEDSFQTKNEEKREGQDQMKRKRPILPEDINVNHSLTSKERQEILDVVNEYRDCFALGMEELGCTDVTKMDIKEVDGSKPVCLRPYKTTASEREAIREIVREWKDNGIVTETRSPYASPVLLVRKKTGDHRLVVDYRRLNIQTVKDKFPLPRIDDLLEGLRNAKFFTTLDLAHGYLQIPLTDKAKLKTAFITPDDTGQFERMIFGLANAPAEFQRLMHTVLGPLLNKKAFCYLDDVIIPAKDWREMIERLREVLERIRSAKLTLKPSKCEFGRREVEFLGYVISTGGLKPGPRKIKAIEEFPEPKNVHDIRRFLGLTNFFRRFVKDFARKAEPLSRLTKKGSQFEWKEEQRRSFGGLRKDLVEYPVLAHYNPELKTEVHCDASAEGLAGMVLQMDEDGKWRLVYCVSKKTTEAEKMYHSSKLELMAIVWTLDRLRLFLVGIKFTVVTDCQALVYMNAKKTTNPQIARWYNLIQEYDFEIRHKPGEKMAHVDGMSRAPVDDPRDTMEEIVEKNLEVCLTITPEEQILMIQHSDPELRDLIQIFRKDPCDRTVGEQNRINDYSYRRKSGRGARSRRYPPTQPTTFLQRKLGRTNLAKHRIHTEDAKPIKHKPYRVSAKERTIIKDQIDEMLEEGIIRPSSIPWFFPVILVKKRDDKYRFCVDYRKLNEVTVKMVETRSGKMQDPAQERIKAEESAKPPLGATIGGDASSDPVVLNPNIDIPKYDGTEDPRPWIESLEEIGFLYHWADYIIARYAAMNMTGSAKTWLNLHKASFTSWENIKIRLIQDFSLDANKEELRMKLNRMQHWNEPAIRFAEDILVLCNKVDPAMEEETKIDHVIGGLKKEYSFALYLNPPKTTDELLVVCKKMDSFEKKYRERVEKSRNLYNGPRYSRPQQQSRYVPPTATRNYQTPSRPQDPVSNNYKNDFPPTPRQHRNNLTQPFTPRRPYNPNFVPKPNLQRNTYNKSQEVSKNRTEDGRPICFKCNKPGHVARYCRVKFIRILEEDPTATQEKIEEKCQMNEISDKSGPRLYADSTINGIKKLDPKYKLKIHVDKIGTFEALVDTGADLSVVDLRTALDTGHGISKLAKTCAGPDGKKLDIVGSILLNIKIDDKALSHKFVILKTHLRTLIFGRDFLKKMNAKIDCKKEIIKYDLTNNHDISNYELKKIKSVEDTVIPELSIRLIKASIEAEDGEYIIEENNRMIQTNGLRLARSLLTVTDRKTHIWITNPYPRPLKIMKDQTLAHGSLPAEVKFIEKLEQINNDEIQFQINKNLSPKEKEDLKQILIKYADLFSPRLGRTNLTKHRIDTEDAKPIKHKPYRVSPKERDIIKDQIDEMLKEGIIRPSSSPWSFPVILVKKRDGKFRFCVDYRKLNEVTVKDVYPIPRIDDVMDTLQGSKYFSAIDLRSGYWQVEIEEKDKEKTAFTTTHGLYEFNVMPFGLCNAPATFERNMDNVLGNLRWQICLCYLDDVIIYSSDFPTHLKRLEAVLKCFSESNLKLNDKKCRFAFEELEILGHITNQQGIKPAEYNIKAVRDFPQPKKVKEVQSFLGMCSYYRKFIKDFSLIADPLTGLIRKNAQFTWTEKQEEAFQNLKKALINPPILGHFDPNAATYIHTDASNIGLGATLVQIICGEEKVISYLSRTLSKAEQNYSTTEKECLAVVWAISKLRPYLYGRHFKIITDHHALCWLKNLKDPTGRLARWALKIQEYDFDIIHKSGKKHMDADGLSRGLLPETDWVKDYERLFLNQIINEEDEFIENVKKSLKGSKRAITQNFKEENGCLYKKNPNPEGRAWLLVVPKKRRKEIMSEFHNHMLNGHLGVARTTYRLKNKYHWPSMLKDVSEFVKTCHLCQSRKGSNQSPSGLLQPIPPANYPFERIGIDFVGPLPSTKRRRKWIIVLTDYYT
ncbi:hypothetical protein LAZ67_18001653, partial [Cordylochernes scorpioides]